MGFLKNLFRRPAPDPVGRECHACRGSGGNGECYRCGGSGRVKKCYRSECQEHGCAGYGDCYVAPSET